MPDFEFAEGDEPAIRRAVGDQGKIAGWPCPFCGASTLLQSHGDLLVDTQRFEVYCNNTFCDAREIVVLILRGDPKPGIRADVLAIETVDQGTEEEQEADGYTLDRDEAGNVISRSIIGGDHMKAVLEPGYANRRLVRRLREAAIEVTPIERDDDRESYED